MSLAILLFHIFSQLPTAVAAQNGGSAWVFKFPACTKEKMATSEEMTCESSPRSPSMNRFAIAARGAALLKADLQQAKTTCLPYTQRSFNEMIQARQNLLSCLAQDAKTRTDVCNTAVDGLRTAITTQWRIIRMALALSRVPDGENPLRSQHLDGVVQLPARMGGGFMVPLNPKIELPLAQSFLQNYVKYAPITAGGGKSLMVNDSGQAVPKDQFEDECRIGTYRNCELYKIEKASQMARFRKSMADVANRAIDALPMAVQFSALPIDDESLARELKKSATTLEGWKTELADDETTMYLTGGEGINNCLSDHPNLCYAVERHVTDLMHKEKSDAIAVAVARVGALGASCIFAGPLMCAATGVLLGAPDLKESMGKHELTSERYLAQTSGDPHTVTQMQLADSYKDVVTKAGILVASAVPGFIGFALEAREAPAVASAASGARSVETEVAVGSSSVKDAVRSAYLQNRKLEIATASAGGVATGELLPGEAAAAGRVVRVGKELVKDARGVGDEFLGAARDEAGGQGAGHVVKARPAIDADLFGDAGAQALYQSLITTVSSSP